MGYRYEVDPEREPGLDLMLLEVDQLRLRYRAENRERRRGIVELRLAPVQSTTQLKEAMLLIDTVTKRLVHLEYEDAEGNQTTFDILGYRTLEGDDGSGAFRAPTNKEWRTE